MYVASEPFPVEFWQTTLMAPEHWSFIYASILLGPVGYLRFRRYSTPLFGPCFNILPTSFVF